MTWAVSNVYGDHPAPEGSFSHLDRGLPFASCNASSFSPALQRVGMSSGHLLGDLVAFEWTKIPLPGTQFALIHLRDFSKVYPLGFPSNQVLGHLESQGWIRRYLTTPTGCMRVLLTDETAIHTSGNNKLLSFSPTHTNKYPCFRETGSR
jgi:hypothetical protein